MIDSLINVLIFSLWIGIFGTPIILFGLRLYYILSRKINGKISLLILFLPFSIGFQIQASEEKFKKVYDSLIILFFVLMVLGSAWLFIQYKRA